ncbi:pilus assembly PilX family protein [Dyella subtropica]|uniref:pilus assembly PilX family protein n=1 Tax=Dyella subtropica TaxID=2992127 RepID=UPI002256542C|nr:PilX N-terminal domain-containing pilus assembly protein [Dyella subtropica]
MSRLPTSHSYRSIGHITSIIHAGQSVGRVRRQHGYSSGRHGQRGVALVVALVLLVVVTLVALAAVRGTTMQQKMAANFYDRETAYQAAEAALRQGEVAVQAATSSSVFRDCTPASTNKCLPNPFADSTVSSSAAVVTVDKTKFDAGALAASQPQYVVEYLGNFVIPPPSVHQLSNCSGYSPCGAENTADFYRVTARSGPEDVKDRASVVLQTVYRR